MNTIEILDTLWLDRPHSIAAALLASRGHYTVIDPGPGSTLATLRQQLEQRRLAISDLNAILLTHIHLDHAGATGALVRENPRLAVYVHSRGVKHMQDPAKLIDSATRLWGAELPRLFGEIVPVPAENLRVLEGGETLRFGDRKLAVEYTPGHASHHVSYFDEQEGTAFVGDTAGIRIEGASYILPATPPPDIDLEVWDKSFATILARRPARLFLTHYGYSEDPRAHFAEYRERLFRWAELASGALRHGANDAAAAEEFVAATLGELAARLPVGEVEHYNQTGSVELSFLGLARYLRKRAATPAPGT
ncbi:MAG: MBL fold metallo-hydrolase [Candidatus Acidiferrum sp.]|jgi:glyoxylase-like metal-dependent hydrolase (beta-lactamase superfamily II)